MPFLPEGSPPASKTPSTAAAASKSPPPPCHERRRRSLIRFTKTLQKWALSRVLDGRAQVLERACELGEASGQAQHHRLALSCGEPHTPNPFGRVDVNESEIGDRSSTVDCRRSGGRRRTRRARRRPERQAWARIRDLLAQGGSTRASHPPTPAAPGTASPWKTTAGPESEEHCPARSPTWWTQSASMSTAPCWLCDSGACCVSRVGGSLAGPVDQWPLGPARARRRPAGPAHSIAPRSTGFPDRPACVPRRTPGRTRRSAVNQQLTGRASFASQGPSEHTSAAASTRSVIPAPRATPHHIAHLLPAPQVHRRRHVAHRPVPGKTRDRRRPRSPPPPQAVRPGRVVR